MSWLIVILSILMIVGSDYLVRRIIITDPTKVENGGERFQTWIGTCYCGRSVAEAKRLGCKYDALQISWTPPECFDEELTEEFNRAGPGPDGEWPYFADDEGKHPLTLEEVALLADTDRGFYSIHAWHLVHCNYSWRKLFRSYTTGIKMDKEILSMGHIKHCGMLEGPTYHNFSLNSLATVLSNSLSGEKEG